MKEEILAAVMFLIKFIEKSDSFPHDQIENFKHHLTTLLLERFEKHWFPERPARGQGYRCIRVNGVCPVDGTLERAASRCGLRYRDLRLPQELTVWVDPAEVCYRLGESEGSYCTLATFPHHPGSKGGATTTISEHLSATTLSSSSTSTLSSDSALSSASSTSSSSGSDTGSDCASLSSRSPSPLAAATTALSSSAGQQQLQQQQQVYQGPMRRSPFTVNGGGRFLRGVGAMQQPQQQQMSCRTTVNMQQQQQRFMVQQQMGATGNRLKPREMGYNVPQASTNSSARTTPSGTWRPDGPQQAPTGFVPPMFNNNSNNPLQPFNHHGPPQFNNSQPPPSHFGRNAGGLGVMGGAPYAAQQHQQQQRMYKNVVRV